MTKITSIILGIALGLMAMSLTGCIQGLTGNIGETNKHIATSNENMFKGFASAVQACKTESCVTAIGMAFAGGMGRQQFMRPDTLLDWIRALNQPLDTLLRYTDRRGQEGGGGATGSLVLKGNQNVVNVGNTAEVKGGGSLIQDLSTDSKPFHEQHTWNQDGQSSGNGTTDRHDVNPPPVEEAPVGEAL